MTPTDRVSLRSPRVAACESHRTTYDMIASWRDPPTDIDIPPPQHHHPRESVIVREGIRVERQR